MKLECIKDKLEAAVSKAEKITEKNATLPVLRCVLLVAQNNSLKIRATNLDLGIETTLPVKIEKEGVVAVPGAILNSFISSVYGSKNITLELKDNNLVVSTDSGSTTIKTYPYEDFPIIPHVAESETLRISAKTLVRGLRSVVYSASLSSIKPELSSVYVYFEDGKIVFVATDSFRLAEKKIPEKKIKGFDPILIPFKNAIEIIRALEDVSDEVEINFNKNQISFTYEGLYLTSRLIDGVFPDYKQIIPKEFTAEAVVLKQDLINLLKLSNIFTDKFNQVVVKTLPTKKIFSVTTKNTDIGENNSTIPAALSGEDLEIAFNYRYILDSFSSLETDSLSLSFTGLNRPMVIRPVGDTSFMYLVMPMNR